MWLLCWLVWTCILVCRLERPNWCKRTPSIPFDHLATKCLRSNELDCYIHERSIHGWLNCGWSLHVQLPTSLWIFERKKYLANNIFSFRTLQNSRVVYDSAANPIETNYKQEHDTRMTHRHMPRYALFLVKFFFSSWTKKFQLTDNVFRWIDASVQLVHIQCVAQFSLNLIGMFFVRHTKAIGNLNNAFVNRTCNNSWGFS